jgi:hypothetical protein
MKQVDARESDDHRDPNGNPRAGSPLVDRSWRARPAATTMSARLVTRGGSRSMAPRMTGCHPFGALPGTLGLRPGLTRGAERVRLSGFRQGSNALRMKGARDLQTFPPSELPLNAKWFRINPSAPLRGRVDRRTGSSPPEPGASTAPVVPPTGAVPFSRAVLSRRLSQLCRNDPHPRHPPHRYPQPPAQRV